MSVNVIHGDCRDVLPTFADNSFDAIVTDPPYHLTTGKKGGSGPASVNLESPYGRSRIGTGFMGMTWDGGDIAHDPRLWAEALRVAKPGAWLLAFGGTRTYHRLACAIEDAGWELRDSPLRGHIHQPEDCPWLMGWMFGTGFPKSHNGEWGGTALKPAWEPIVAARKPLIGTVEENWRAHGVGGLNIEATRIAAAGEGRPLRELDAKYTRNNVYAGRMDGGSLAGGSKAVGETTLGRWPANIIHDGSDAIVAHFPQEAGAAAPVHRRNGDKFRNTYGAFAGDFDEQGSTFQGDSGSAARFFYCAKASREDRDEGCEAFDKRPLLWSSGEQNPGSFQSPNTDRSARNFHPTVKPTALMRWLVRLVTPPGGKVLDCFAGSGSTGKACELEGFDGVLIEGEQQYVPIIEARLAFAREQRRIATAQQSLFA